jgi:hypothetical protein
VASQDAKVEPHSDPAPRISVDIGPHRLSLRVGLEPHADMGTQLVESVPP